MMRGFLWKLIFLPMFVMMFPSCDDWNKSLLEPYISNTSLKSLSIIPSRGGVSLEPAFRHDIRNYTATVDYGVSLVNIFGEPYWKDTVVQPLIDQTLSEGMTLSLYVNSANGNSSVYTVTFHINKPNLELTCTLAGIGQLAFEAFDLQRAINQLADPIVIIISGFDLPSNPGWYAFLDGAPLTVSGNIDGCSILLPASPPPSVGTHSITVILETSVEPPLSYSGSFPLTITPPSLP